MRRTLIVTLAALTAFALAGAGDADRHGAPPVDDPRFDFLKSLEGRWVAETEMEGMSEVVIEFRVTAGGHAVEEREMIGTPMEMVTLYHMEGRDLVATHYCVLGNQPRLKAARRVVDDRLDFACAGKPGNARSHDEEHVHGWSMQLDGDDTLQYTAELLKEGDVSEAPSFVLTRQVETASR